MSKISESIKELYGGNISDGEAMLAETNLLGFFKLLKRINERLQAEAKFQNKSNEETYENNRSSN